MLFQAAVNRKGVLSGEGPHLKDEDSAIELAAAPPVSATLRGNEQYSRVPSDIV